MCLCKIRIVCKLVYKGIECMHVCVCGMCLCVYECVFVCVYMCKIMSI